MIHEKQQVKTYYRTDKKTGKKNNYYQINLSTKTHFKDSNIIIISEDDFNNLCDDLKKYEKLQNEYKLLVTRNDELINNIERLENQLNYNTDALKENKELKNQLHELDTDLKETTKENKALNKVIQGLLLIIQDYKNRNILARLRNTDPASIKELYKADKIKELLKITD